MSNFLAGLKSYFIVHVQWIWDLITCLSTMCDWFSNLQFTVIRSLTLLILVFSKETLIIFAKTKPEHGKWRKHDIHGSMAPFNHLLSFAYGLYMTTATFLNGHLYTEGHISFTHFMHTCANISPFSVKKRLFINSICYIDSCINIFTNTTGYFNHMKPNIDP